MPHGTAPPPHKELSVARIHMIWLLSVHMGMSGRQLGDETGLAGRPGDLEPGVIALEVVVELSLGG